MNLNDLIQNAARCVRFFSVKRTVVQSKKFDLRKLGDNANLDPNFAIDLCPSTSKMTYSGH
jgi:hypothetical protein